MMIEINEKIVKRAELQIDKSIFDKVLEMLNNEADYFLDKNFGMKREIPIEINSRLTFIFKNETSCILECGYC